MGKKLDALFGRNNFKTHKFKPQVNLAISRLAILKNQRQVKCSQARSDVLQLLQQGFHEQALLRVQYVIKEQNMLDAFIMMEGYCNLLTERVHLIEQDKVCPDELKEAISTLLFASSRCGEFPELQEIRALFTSRYGKEFVGSAIELRNNCGVNTKMIQKLSTRLPDLDNRMKRLKEIAAEYGIALQLEEGSGISAEKNLDVFKNHNQAETEALTNSAQGKPGESSQISPKEKGKEGGFSDSFKVRKKYKDVADAAQAAFESAAYAAEAARAAVELSRSDSLDPDDYNSPRNPQREVADRQKLVNLASESKNQEIHSELQAEESKHSRNTAEPERTVSSSDSTEDKLNVTTMSFDELDPVKLLEKDVVFYDSDSEDSGLSRKEMPSISKAQKVEGGHLTAHAVEGSVLPTTQYLDMVKSPVSVRTSRVRGY